MILIFKINMIFKNRTIMIMSKKNKKPHKRYNKNIEI